MPFVVVRIKYWTQFFFLTNIMQLLVGHCTYLLEAVRRIWLQQEELKKILDTGAPGQKKSVGAEDLFSMLPLNTLDASKPVVEKLSAPESRTFMELVSYRLIFFTPKCSSLLN